MRRLGSGIFVAIVAVAAALLAGGCPGHLYTRGYPEPRLQEILDHIQSGRTRVSAVRADTLTDFRLGDQRVQLEVLMQAQWGGKVRFQAIDPNNMTAADLAADGQQFCFLDAHHNCGECGPETADVVGQFLGIDLQPDDLELVMVGSTPVLPNATGSVAWDPKSGEETVSLESAGYKQVIRLDGRDKTWDVLSSEVTDPDGKLVWRVQHKGFHVAKNAAGEPVRLPGKSLFEQPKDYVRIIWHEQTLDPKLNERAFTMPDFPTGISACGGGAPTEGPAAHGPPPQQAAPIESPAQ